MDAGRFYGSLSRDEISVFAHGFPRFALGFSKLSFGFPEFPLGVFSLSFPSVLFSV